MLRRLWLNSQTVLLAKVQAGTALIVGLNSVLQSTEFKNVLTTVQTPWYVPTVIAVVALLTYLAHGHSTDA